MNRKEFIIVLIVTFVVIMVWVGADILHTKSAVQIDPKLQTVIDPVDPNFDLETLELIQNPPRFAPVKEIATESASLQ